MTINLLKPAATDSDLLAYRDPALLQIESSLEQEWAEIVAQANARLDAILADFREMGEVLTKTADDLFFELEFENDWEYNDDPENAIQITLLQLLQVSTARLQAGNDDADLYHIHHLIEHAFIEQEGLHIIAEQWEITGNGDFSKEHFALLDAAVRPYLSEHGLLALERIGEQVKRLTESAAKTDTQAVDPTTLKVTSTALAAEQDCGK